MEDINYSRISQAFFEALAKQTGSVEDLQEIEKWLIMHGKDLDSMINLAKQKNSENETALIVACQHGNLDAVKYLVEHCQADVEQEGMLLHRPARRLICRPLHRAVIDDNVEIVRYLVEDCKASVNAQTVDITPNIGSHDSWPSEGGNTPLHLAASGEHANGRLLIASCLMQNGADPTIRNDRGYPVWEKAWNADFVKVLIRHGMNINDTNEKNDTLAHIWTRSMERGSTERESTEVVQLLLERGCDLLKNNDGMTPLQLAAIGYRRRLNHDTFRTIFEHREQFLSRIDKIEGLELIGASSFLGNDFQNGMFYWRKAMELRCDVPNEPPLRKCFFPYSHCARLAFENQSEVETLEELEELARYNAEALRVQALMTYCRLLRTDSPVIIEALKSHASHCLTWKAGQQYINFSILIVECLQSLENQEYQTAYTLLGLVKAFCAFNIEGSYDRQLVNFSNIIPVLQCISNALKRLDGKTSIEHEYWNSDGARNILLNCVIQLTIILSSLPLTHGEAYEFKRCLYGVMILQEQTSREQYNLLLLACSKSKHSFGCDELRYENEFGNFQTAAAIDLFLELGIDPNSTDWMGNTGLHLLAQNKQTYDSPAFRILYEAGAHLDKVNHYGKTMADLMNRKLTRHPNHIFRTPFEFPKLKCLVARVVRNECIASHSDLAPLGLFDFVMQH